MAKRKRLTPVEISVPAAAPETKSMGAHPFGIQPTVTRRPPIAQVVGDAAAQAALKEVADELHTAKTSGRMVLELPLEAVDETYLVRDRLVAETDELSVLMVSLTARGQQAPIEVVDLGQGRYGLISGWRRLTALRRLNAADEQGEFSTVQALLRRPENASDAYLAMVEENEIRVGLSYYERARIVARATEQGVYPTSQMALKGLFGAVSRSKRSKIASFLKIYAALDRRLHFPSAISERFGLALVKALEADPQMTIRLNDRLRKASPADAAAEIALLERALQSDAEKKQSLMGGLETVFTKNVPIEQSSKVATGITMTSRKGRVVLSGNGITLDLVAELATWLGQR